MAAQEGKARFHGIVSATRLHLPPDATAIPEATEGHLRSYLASVSQLGLVAAIAVNAFEEPIRRIAEEVAPGGKVFVLPVPCWGAFVPALNTLLNFSQRCGMKYILYQSLEVQCTPTVLQRFLDHHTADTLVVGPVFNGHDFKAGEQPLNGRTTPWNTLALWSVRKLALTGFLCIADGLPDVPPSIGREGYADAANPQESDEASSLGLGPMGSDAWWTRDLVASSASSVPAGVEEVTAIALLQHLHGKDRARAVLLQLPRELEAELSWEASWGKDERRAKWHKYKMESKVSRPAAQLEELFNLRRVHSNSDVTSPTGGVTGKLNCMRRRFSSDSDLANSGSQPVNSQDAAPQAAPEVKEAPAAPNAAASSPHFATVMHYGESIAPPPRVLWICLASCGLFSANSTAVLASAFRAINANPSASAAAFVGLLIGAVYLPMPLSLCLTRTVTHRANHIAGLALFGGFLLLGHMSMVFAQLFGWGEWVMLLARLVQGLGSGILFQARFVLASLSTSDQHNKLQSLIFLANDLGLGLGALLPAALQPATGYFAMPPDLLASVVLACISLAYLVWVLLAFPRRLPFLSDKVRFRRSSEQGERSSSKEAAPYRVGVLVSGTMRVFVQSAILPVAALSMRDAHWTGNFRQTFAVAAICLLPMPFEALASRICCGCSLRLRSVDGLDSSKLASGLVGAVALLIVSISPRSVIGEDGETLALLMRISELAILMIALAMAAPFNASRLYQLKDAERTIVMLEWMKAYLGRLLGPLSAVLLYNWVGYPALLAVLCLATGVVTITA